MRGYRLLLYAVGAAVTVLAAVVAIAVFKNEIVDFFTSVSDSVLDKLSGNSHPVRRKTEYSDYADV
jgi:hypothetical protein